MERIIICISLTFPTWQHHRFSNKAKLWAGQDKFKSLQYKQILRHRYLVYLLPGVHLANTDKAFRKYKC